jgi:hypothetical protein
MEHGIMSRRPRPPRGAHTPKKILSAFYEGAPLSLFIPTPAMCSLHEAARRLGPAGTTVEAVTEEAGCTDGMTKWLRRYAGLPWFGGWLFNGDAAPEGVRVLDAFEVERARTAWNYGAHCYTAGLHPCTYDRWFKKGLILGSDWLDWLYGGQLPAGWLVVTETMGRFREEGTHQSTAAAAGFSLSLVSLWRKNDKVKKCLDAAMALDSSPGVRTPSRLRGVPEWADLSEATRASLWRYAHAATLPERCRRAEVSRGHYLKWLRAARDVDAARGTPGAVLTALTAFLNPWRDAARGRAYRQGGVLVPGLFLPPPGMHAFRQVARQAMARGQVWTSLRALPHFAEWMHDWATPRPRLGRRPTDGWGAAAEPSPDPSGTLTERAPAPPPDATQAKTKKRRRGRPRGVSKQTKDRYEEIRREWASRKYASQSELADKLGIHRSTVCRVLEGSEPVAEKSPL